MATRRGGRKKEKQHRTLVCGSHGDKEMTVPKVAFLAAKRIGMQRGTINPALWGHLRRGRDSPLVVEADGASASMQFTLIMPEWRKELIVPAEEKLAALPTEVLPACENMAVRFTLFHRKYREYTGTDVKACLEIMTRCILEVPGEVRGTTY